MNLFKLNQYEPLIYYLPRVNLLGKEIEIVISSKNGEDLDTGRICSHFFFIKIFPISKIILKD
jgi:hypothetical protein